MNNNPQLTILVRKLLTIVGTLLIAHGAVNVGNSLMTSEVIGDVSELLFGAGSLIYSIYLSHKKAAQIPVVAVPSGNDAQGNTTFTVRPANAIVTKNDPTPKNITDAQPIKTVSVPTQ